MIGATGACVTRAFGIAVAVRLAGLEQFVWILRVNPCWCHMLWFIWLGRVIEIRFREAMEGSRGLPAGEGPGASQPTLRGRVDKSGMNE